MLVLGAGRQVADLRWGVQAFGQLSFALSLVNAGLAFLAQVGLVLFPMLRRMEAEGCAAAFRRMQKRLFLLLPAVYILYFPCAFFLKRWLPDYAASLACLPALMPICYFDCQMHLVGATFLKVLGRQDQLLRINLTAVGVCILCSLAAAWGPGQRLWGGLRHESGIGLPLPPGPAGPAQNAGRPRPGPVGRGSGCGVCGSGRPRPLAADGAGAGGVPGRPLGLGSRKSASEMVYWKKGGGRMNGFLLLVPFFAIRFGVLARKGRQATG